MANIEITREVLLRDEGAGQGSKKALGWFGLTLSLSFLPCAIRRPIEDAIRESLVSGFSTMLLATALFAIAAGGLTWLLNQVARH